MRRYQTVIAALSVVGLAGAGSAVLAQQGKTSAQPKAHKATVMINGGYQPAKITAKAGRPIQITFHRMEKAGCGDVVQFPTQNIKRKLKTGEKTVVTLTPKKAGTIPFTCGMNMYKGQVVVQ